MLLNATFWPQIPIEITRILGEKPSPNVVFQHTVVTGFCKDEQVYASKIEQIAELTAKLNKRGKIESDVSMERYK
jgi:hypothetical protein